MKFYDYTLLAGSKHSRREWESDQLVPQAVSAFSKLLQEKNFFYREIHKNFPGISLSFMVNVETSALAVFYYQDVPVTSSILLSGLDEQEDQYLRKTFQERVITPAFYQTALEPGFDLADIKERPVIASLLLPSAITAGKEIIEIIADMETCLVAAYFEALLV